MKTREELNDYQRRYRSIVRQRESRMAAVQEKPRIKADDACICGKPHRNTIPWTRRSDYGSGWKLTFYCSNACKSKAVRQA